MPDTAIFKLTAGTKIIDLLSKKDRRHFTKDVLPFCDQFEIVKLKQLSEMQLNEAYELYANVKNNNLAINNFLYDKKVFESMNKHDNWEFILASLPNSDTIIGCVFCYVNHYNKSYNPILIGLIDKSPFRLKLYRQLLYKTICIANEMHFQAIYFGFSATFEKKKFGAKLFSKYAYIFVKENFDIDQLSNFEN